MTPLDAPAQPIPTRDDFRTLIIDAIRGVGFPTVAVGVMAERQGLAVYSPSRQGEPGWVWDREKLSALDTPVLQELYISLKEARDGC